MKPPGARSLEAAVAGRRGEPNHLPPRAAALDPAGRSIHVPHEIGIGFISPVRILIATRLDEQAGSDDPAARTAPMRGGRRGDRQKDGREQKECGPHGNPLSGEATFRMGRAERAGTIPGSPISLAELQGNGVRCVRPARRPADHKGTGLRPRHIHCGQSRKAALHLRFGKRCEGMP